MEPGEWESSKSSNKERGMFQFTVIFEAGKWIYPLKKNNFDNNANGNKRFAFFPIIN